MIKNLILACVAVFVTISSSGQSLTNMEILEKSMQFHDPNNSWGTWQVNLEFTETRPSGPDRKTRVEIDQPNSYFRINRDDKEIHGVKADSCFVVKGDANCQRAITMRNYYTYLWGLPMKLTDPGTEIDRELRTESLNGINCHVLKVAYEKDTWYYYIAQDDFAMIAYKFYKDEAAGKGELITTDGLFEYEGVRVPNNRTWYELPGNKILGTDILVQVTQRNVD